MVPVLFPRSEIDSRVQSSWYFSKIDVSPRLGHFCQFVHCAARWHAHAAETNQTLSQMRHIPEDMEETCYSLMTRCRLPGSTKWIDFLDDVVPVIASLLWTTLRCGKPRYGTNGHGLSYAS